MATWQNLPKCLQKTDAEIAQMSWSEIQALFNCAEDLGVLNVFSELFWDAVNRVRCGPDNTSMQQCVDFLEERKRSLGRMYSITKARYPTGWLARFTAVKYNECEYNIRWLVDQYCCVRRSEPYLLEVRK